jgi:hypothetical protein
MAGRIEGRSAVCRRRSAMMPFAVPAMALALAAAARLLTAIGKDGNGGEDRQQKQRAEKDADNLV